MTVTFFNLTVEEKVREMKGLLNINNSIQTYN